MYAYAAFGELPAFVLFAHLMLDYHIGAASLARSLAGHLSSLAIQIFPPVESWLPAVLAPGGMPLLDGWLSINLLAPLLLGALTVILCRGVRESSTLNAGMTVVKVRRAAFSIRPDWCLFSSGPQMNATSRSGGARIRLSSIKLASD